MSIELCGHCGGDADPPAHAIGHCLGRVPVGMFNEGATVEANQAPGCLSIRRVGDDGGDDDVIHICDWPAARAVIDAFQAARGSDPPPEGWNTLVDPRIMSLNDLALLGSAASFVAESHFEEFRDMMRNRFGQETAHSRLVDATTRGKSTWDRIALEKNL